MLGTETCSSQATSAAAPLMRKAPDSSSLRTTSMRPVWLSSEGVLPMEAMRARTCSTTPASLPPRDSVSTLEELYAARTASRLASRYSSEPPWR